MPVHMEGHVPVPLCVQMCTCVPTHFYDGWGFVQKMTLGIACIVGCTCLTSRVLSFIAWDMPTDVDDMCMYVGGLCLCLCVRAHAADACAVVTAVDLLLRFQSMFLYI